MTRPPGKIEVRNTQPSDIPGIIELTRQVYPASPPWTAAQLESHLAVFPEGQLVAVDQHSGRVEGMASSLIVLWDDYGIETDWRAFTDRGYFTNHDPQRGRTLYGAEVMVSPGRQGSGIGKRLYSERRALTERLGLLRIRAGARLRAYHRFARRVSAEEYVAAVVRGELKDPTLSFQLRQGFEVLAVVEGYLQSDPESLGYAALIEWFNSKAATPADLAARAPRLASASPMMMK